MVPSISPQELRAENEARQTSSFSPDQQLRHLEQRTADWPDAQAGYVPTFADVFDLEQIQAIQDSFAAATGVASIITDPAGKPLTRPSNFCRLCNDIIRVTPTGMANCMRSDALIGRPNPDGPTIQPCLSGGLVDGGVSIFMGEHHIANWLIGQVLEGNPDEEKMLDYARKIGADEAQFRLALGEVKRMSREQFNQVAQTLSLIAGLFSRLAEQNHRQARDLAALRAAEEQRDALQREVIEAQQAALRELSTPLIPVADGVLVMPLVGSIDSSRAQQIMESLLEGVATQRARAAILDITGIKVVDTQVAGALLRAAQAARLLGAEVILTGISPEVAQTLVQIGADLSALTTRGALQSGIAWALSRH